MVYDAQLARMRGDADGRHEEWLLDDAIAHTFPASDPVSHGQPGSLVNMRYAAWQRAASRRARRRARSRDFGRPAVAFFVVGGVACAWLLARALVSRPRR